MRCLLPPVQRSRILVAQPRPLMRCRRAVGHKQAANALHGNRMEVEGTGDRDVELAWPPSACPALSRKRARTGFGPERSPSHRCGEVVAPDLVERDTYGYAVAGPPLGGDGHYQPRPSTNSAPRESAVTDHSIKSAKF
jgi:hypothetical protein